MSADFASFKGLAYFDIRRGYRLQARFIRTPNEPKFEMATTTGRIKIYLKYGELKFKLAGRLHTLNLYQSQPVPETGEYIDYLLLPFTDLTNGNETYGGGRYIDFRIPTSETVVLDFNLAYNPSCAYNHKYSCPIPPRENHLALKINAGEKSYKSHIEHQRRRTGSTPSGQPSLIVTTSIGRARGYKSRRARPLLHSYLKLSVN